MNDTPRFHVDPPIDPIVVADVDAAFLDLERAYADDGHRAHFWDALEHIAEIYGVELVLTPTRSAARWDHRRHPPQLLEATARFRRRGYVRPKPPKRPRELPPPGDG